MNKFLGIGFLALAVVGCSQKSDSDSSSGFIEVGAPPPTQTRVASAPKPEKMDRVPSGFPIYTGLVTKPAVVEGRPIYDGVKTEEDYPKVVAEYKRIAKDWRCEEIGRETWLFKPATNGETMRIMIVPTPEGKSRIVMASMDLNQLQMVVANIFPFLKERGREDIKGITTKRMWKDIESGKIDAQLAGYKFMAGARKDGSKISSIPIETKDHKRFLCQCHMVVEDGLPRIDSLTIIPEK